MIVTLHLDETYWERDIKVNREQKIRETLWILVDAGVLPTDTLQKMKTVFSERQGICIDPEQTYQQAEVYQGDILHIR